MASMQQQVVLLSLVLVLATCVGTVLSQSDDDTTAKCLPRILPCAPYLHDPKPPAICCVPLNQLIIEDPKCLCSLFYNDKLLRSFNVTRDDCISMAHSCGSKPDLSLCKNSGGGSGSGPAPPAHPPPPATPARPAHPPPPATPTPPAHPQPKTPPTGSSKSGADPHKSLTTATKIMAFIGFFLFSMF